MPFGSGIADLHIHTTASDGTDSLAERVRQASKRDLDTIAITDHDRLPADLTERVEIRSDINIISGVEVRAELFETKVEILGYYLDPDNDRLQSMLKEARDYRHERNRDLIERLNEVTEITLDYESIQEEVDGNLGRPHLAQRLVKEGIVESTGAAFNQYLAEEGAAFVPMERLDYQYVLDTIYDAEGVTSLAHPGRIRSKNVPVMLEELTKAGLDGIEVWYPYSSDRSQSYAGIGLREAAALAKHHDLVPTGGSDCHGIDSEKFRIGDVRISDEALKQLRLCIPTSLNNV
jgi:predicted metal-dependent phosphoesterase TrpH